MDRYAARHRQRNRLHYYALLRKIFSYRYDSTQASFSRCTGGEKGTDAASVHSGYRIYSTYRRTASGEYTGDLKVVRIADAKVIYPFDGAAIIGPFPIAQAARDAAAQLGATLVVGDLQNPEP